MARIDIPDGDGGEAVQLFLMRPELGGPAGKLSHAAYHKSIVPVREREAARMRIAQINQCQICLSYRATSVQEQGVPEALYAHVAEHREHGDYTERERLAIEYAERFALDHRNIDDGFWTRMRDAFSDDEIVDLTLCLVVFLGLGRMLAVLEIDPSCAIDW
jgi:alkylhydroperoxidase family enzyme